MPTARRLLNAIFLAGIGVGLWHLVLAVDAMAAFRASEPLASWIAIFAGPCATLPGALASRFNAVAAGNFLLLAAATATIAFLVGLEQDPSSIAFFLGWFTIPMALLGGSLLAAGNLERVARRHGE